MKTLVLVSAFLIGGCTRTTATPGVTPLGSSAVIPGIEVFLSNVPPALRGKRVGLITNQSAVDRHGVPDIDLIAQHKDLKLVALFAPGLAYFTSSQPRPNACAFLMSVYGTWPLRPSVASLRPRWYACCSVIFDSGCVRAAGI